MDSMIYILMFLFGCVILLYSADKLIDNSLLIAKKFNLSEKFIGITLIAFGTSLPEFIVSVSSNIKGEQDILIGNIIGSNNANIGLVLALTALVYPIKVNFQIIKKDMYAVLIITLATFFMFLNNNIFFYEGIFLLVMFIIYLFMIDVNIDSDEIEKNTSNILNNSIIVILAFVGLLAGSELFIHGAIGIANIFEVNKMTIGMTIVALGTSLPELSTTLVAAKKKKFGIVVGNVIGSNIFNIIFVLSLNAIFSSIMINYTIIQYDLYFFIIFCLLLFFVLKIFFGINRISGLIFLLMYILFVLITFSI